MTRITIRNKARVPVRWGGHTFPPGKETTVDLDDARIARVRHQRRLSVVSTSDAKGKDDAPAWGSTVDDAKSYVGEDKTRAAEVLSAEQAKGDKARKSLVEHLEAVLDDGEED